MPFTGKVGDTLYLKDCGENHRYIILTKPNKAGDVVLVNFTSARYWKEWTVTFTPRDDKGLFEHKTTVAYAYSRLVPLQALIDAQKKNRISNYEYCAENHTKKIIIGAFQSDSTPNEIIEELKTQYPKEHQQYYK